MAEQPTHSLQKFSTLVRLNPDDPSAHFGLAMAYEESGQQNYAFKEYQEVLRLDPRHARAHLNMGFAYCKGGEVQPAIKEWQKAYELDSNAGRFLDDPKTKAYYEPKVEHAMAMFERPVMIRSDDSYAHYQLAMAYRYFNKKEMALAELKKAVELNPNLWEAYNASGEIYADLGQLQFAKIQYQKAISVSPRHPDTFYNLGTIFEDEGMVGIAIQKYERALEIDPGNSKLLFALGRAYLKQARFKKAIVQFQKSIDKEPDNPFSHFHLAKACEAIYRPDFAIREYELAVKIDPRYAEAHYNLGTLYINTGNLSQGVEHLERSLKLNPKDSYAFYNLGNAYDKLGEFQKAIFNYNHALELNPRDAFARYNLGQIYFKMDQFEEAISEFEKALEINPNDASFYLNLGKAYLELEDYDSAVEMFQRSVENKPNDFESHYALARAFMITDRLDLAVMELKKVTEINPSAPEPHFDLAQCLYSNGEVDQAFDQFQKVLIYDEKHLDAIQGVGQIYLYYRGKPDIAIDFFNQALEVDEHYFPALLEKGNAFLRLRKLKAAQKEYEKAARINPDDLDLLISLAEVYVATRKLDAAEREMQKAINLEPENSRFRLLFARVLGKNKKTESAIEQYRKAIALDDTLISAYIELTDQLLIQGDEHGSKSTLTVLLDHEPGNLRAQKALENLFENPGQDLTGTSVTSLSGIAEERPEPEVVTPEAAEAPAPEAVTPQAAESAKDSSGKSASVKKIVKPKLQIKKKGLRSKLKSSTTASREETLSAPVISPQVLTTFTKAITAQARGKDQEAAELFEQVVDKSPQYYQAYSYLGELLSKLGKTEESTSILRRGKSLAERYKDKEYIDIFNKHLGVVSAVAEPPVETPLPSAVKEEAAVETEEPSKKSPFESDSKKELNPDDFELFDMNGKTPEESTLSARLLERKSDTLGKSFFEDEEKETKPGEEAPPEAESPVEVVVEEEVEVEEEKPTPVGVRDQGLPSWVVYEEKSSKSEEIDLSDAPTLSAYTSAPQEAMGYTPPKPKLPDLTQPEKKSTKPLVSHELEIEEPAGSDTVTTSHLEETAVSETRHIEPEVTSVPELHDKSIVSNEELPVSAAEVAREPEPVIEEEIHKEFDEIDAAQEIESMEAEIPEEGLDFLDEEPVETEEVQGEVVSVTSLEPVAVEPPVIETEEEEIEPSVYPEPTEQLETPRQLQEPEEPKEPKEPEPEEPESEEPEPEEPEFIKAPTEHLEKPEDEIRPGPVRSIPQSSGFLSEEMSEQEIKKRLVTIDRFLRLRKFNQAQVELEKLAETFPDHPEIARTHASLYKMIEDWGEYAKKWARFMEVSGDIGRENKLVLVDALERAGDLERALEASRALVSADPDDLDASALTCELMIKAGQAKEAISPLQKLSRKKPGVQRYMFDLARAYREIGKYSLATVQYQKVLRHVESPEICNELGLTYEKVGKTNSAVNYYKRAISLDEENVTGHLSLILLYESMGKYEKAIEAIENALDNCDLEEEQEEILGTKRDELAQMEKQGTPDKATEAELSKAQTLFLEMRKELEKEEARTATDFLISRSEEEPALEEDEDEEEEEVEEDTSEISDQVQDPEEDEESEQTYEERIEEEPEEEPERGKKPIEPPTEILPEPEDESDEEQDKGSDGDLSIQARKSKAQKTTKRHRRKKKRSKKK